MVKSHPGFRMSETEKLLAAPNFRYSQYTSVVRALCSRKDPLAGRICGSRAKKQKTAISVGLAQLLVRSRADLRFGETPRRIGTSEKESSARK